jgi:phosphate transport system protein
VRARFAGELAEIEGHLARELIRAGAVLELIADAVVRCSAGRAGEIARAADRLRAAGRHVDAQLIEVTARQAPVAGDLRLVVSLIQVAHRGVLIANQFGLIGEQLGELDPDVRDPQQTVGQLSMMTELARRQILRATQAFAARDAEAAITLERQDDALDRINRQVFEATLGLDADPSERELAFRYVLIARSLERIGDNAVDIAEQAVFLVTAQLQEFSDASRPKSARMIERDGD